MTSWPAISGPAVMAEPAADAPGGPGRWRRRCGFWVMLPARLLVGLRRPGLAVGRLLRMVAGRALFGFAVAGFLFGLVLALPGLYGLADSSPATPPAPALFLLGGLGLLVASLLFVVWIGAGVAREVALMSTTDQFAALEMMSIDPQRQVVAPRLLAGMFALPLLALVFLAAAIGGAFVVAALLHGTEPAVYWQQVEAVVRDRGWVPAVAVVAPLAGIGATATALFEAQHCTPGAAGVSRAVARAVSGGTILVLVVAVAVLAVLVAMG